MAHKCWQVKRTLETKAYKIRFRYRKHACWTCGATTNGHFFTTRNHFEIALNAELTRRRQCFSSFDNAKLKWKWNDLQGTLRIMGLLVQWFDQFNSLFTNIWCQHWQVERDYCPSGLKRSESLVFHDLGMRLNNPAPLSRSTDATAKGPGLCWCRQCDTPQHGH